MRPNNNTNNNNNNHNTNVNDYGAVIMTTAIARVHLLSIITAEKMNSHNPA